jgi:hypothetical protein
VFDKYFSVLIGKHIIIIRYYIIYVSFVPDELVIINENFSAAEAEEAEIYIRQTTSLVFLSIKRPLHLFSRSGQKPSKIELL